MLFSDKKLVFAGDFVHLYEYDYPTAYDFKMPKNEGAVQFKKDLKKDIQSHPYRAKQMVKFLLQSNIAVHSAYTPQFATLTFAENITQLAEANPLFKKFTKRLEWDVGHKLQYLVVPEFQKRGAVHYHEIFFNLPFISQNDFQSIWKYGYVFKKSVKNSNHLINYVSKYLTKNNNNERYKKKFFTSRGLKRPEIIRDAVKINSIIRNLGSPQFENQYKYKSWNDKQKQTTYKIWRLKTDEMQDLTKNVSLVNCPISISTLQF